MIVIASWLLLPVVLALIVVAMAALSAARNASVLSPECARKIFHVSMGMMALSFPWLFANPAPVLLLAGLACAWFEAVRWLVPLVRGYGAVLSAVARPGRGEIHFVMGTALTFLLADGTALAFCLPMAILALADAAAALVGQRFGSRPRAIRFRGKSLAGSSAFFAVALAVSLVGLLIAGWTVAQAMVMAMLMACTTTVLEAVARRGADNFLIPLGATFLLRSPIISAASPGRVTLVLGIVAITFSAIGAFAIWRTREIQP